MGGDYIVKKMIHLLGNIPNNITLACSGGPDSMGALAFLLQGRKNVTLAYFNHGSAHGNTAQKFVTDIANKHGLHLKIGSISRPQNKEESIEEYWRNERYNFLHKLPGSVITAHHLDDVAEWWVFSSLNGQSRLIPYRKYPNIIRPFLKSPKCLLLNCVIAQNMPFLHDPSNTNTRYRRNLIRKKIMPYAFEVNPGLHKVLSKKIEKAYQAAECQIRPAC
jgi:tRNA(Ile)-lysidine synthase